MGRGEGKENWVGAEERRLYCWGWGGVEGRGVGEERGEAGGGENRKEKGRGIPYPSKFEKPYDG